MAQNGCDKQNLNQEALLDLMDKSGYNIVQENGQRKYGGPPPDWTGAPPPKGSEVFVGKIPRDLYEDELVPVFEKVGKLYELRLMMDFSGSNRGYAFVMYTNANDAMRAVKLLNNYEIRKGRFLGVVKSIDNCRLFVGGIPKTKTREEIKHEMSNVTEGVVDVILYSSVTDKSKSRGFAFVEYESHRAAAMARRQLIPGKIQLWGHEIAVDWAEPEPEVDEETMSTVRVLYVRNLVLSTTEDQIRDLFNKCSNDGVEKVKKLKDFAFVHFVTREQAQKAREALDGTVLDNSELEVTWAKPVDKTFCRKAARGAISGLGYNSVTHQPVYDPSVYGYSHPVVTASSPMVRSPTKTRGRGAAGLRGGRYIPPGLMRGVVRRPVEIRFYDLLPGTELVPTNPYTLRPVRSSPQILAELCGKNRWAEPVYQLMSTRQPQPGGGDPQQLFQYKVTMPSFQAQYAHFEPNKLCTSPEEAKQVAADLVLQKLGVSTDGEATGAAPCVMAPRPLVPAGAATCGLGQEMPASWPSPVSYTTLSPSSFATPYMVGKILAYDQPYYDHSQHTQPFPVTAPAPAIY